MAFSNNGWTAQALAYWLDRLRAAIKDECKLKTDAEVSDYRYVLARLVLVIAREVTGIDSALAAAFTALDPSAAFGRMLDIAGWRLGVPRLAAARSVLAGRVYGTPGTALNGELVRAEGELWQITAAAVIGAGGYADVQARAVRTGPLAVPVAGIGGWALVDTVTGWTGFASLSAVAIGRDLETDDLYLPRIAAAEGVAGGTEPAIRAAISAVSAIGIWSVTVNRTGDVDANGIPGHYVEVCATGATDLAIAIALLDSASGTAGFWGNTLVQVPPFQAGAGTIPVAISRPEPVRCYSTITLYTTGAEITAPGDIEAQAAAIVSAWAATLQPGEDPTAGQAEAQVIAGLPARCIVAVTVRLNRDNVSLLTSVEILAREYARISNTPSPAVMASVEQGPFVLTLGWQVVIRSAGVDATVIFDGSETTRDLVVARLVAGLGDTMTAAATANGSFQVASVATGVAADLEIRAGSDLGLLVALGLPLVGSTEAGADTDITVGTL